MQVAQWEGQRSEYSDLFSLNLGNYTSFYVSRDNK